MLYLYILIWLRFFFFLEIEIFMVFFNIKDIILVVIKDLECKEKLEWEENLECKECIL